jgi:lysozyme family protein
MVIVKYANEYRTLFSTMKIKADKLPEIDLAVKKINAGKGRYEALEKITGVPWFFIGMIHYMEASNNFSKHLHNGDPLTGRTVNVPKGRPLFNPKKGTIGPSSNNPYTFEESAIDAMQYMGFDKIKDWSIEQMLYLLEKFNGFGYRRSDIKINSPYLWSYSNHYTKGKFVTDGVYNPATVSKQAGVAVILQRVLDKNNLLSKYIKAAAVGGASIGIILLAVFF